MAIRYIVRPSGILTTPNALKEALGAAQVVKASFSRERLSLAKDFFFAYPDPAVMAWGGIEGQKASYHRLYGFFCNNKYYQRAAMHNAGLKVPVTLGINATAPDLATSRNVIRPYRHMAGQGFEVVTGVPNQSRPGYISQVFNRTHEYRVIYVFGERVATLLKRVPSALTQEQPWTHGNGVTFSHLSAPVANHRLTSRGFYSAAEAFFVTQQAHICAYDVMVSEDSYAVSELNFCPSLKVDDRIAKVAARIRAVRP